MIPVSPRYVQLVEHAESPQSSAVEPTVDDQHDAGPICSSYDAEHGVKPGTRQPGCLFAL